MSVGVGIGIALVLVGIAAGGLVFYAVSVYTDDDPYEGSE